MDLMQKLMEFKMTLIQVRKITSGNGQASLLISGMKAPRKNVCNIDLWSWKRLVKVLDADKENGANERVKKNKTFPDGSWPLFNEREILVNLLDGCPCCLEVYQLIRSYSESGFPFLEIQAEKIDPFNSIQKKFRSGCQLFKTSYSLFRWKAAGVFLNDPCNNCNICTGVEFPYINYVCTRRKTCHICIKHSEKRRISYIDIWSMCIHKNIYGYVWKLQISTYMPHTYLFPCKNKQIWMCIFHIYFINLYLNIKINNIYDSNM